MMKKTTTLWLLGLLAVLTLFATIYFVAHYVLRSSANEPQLQIANDTAWKAALQLAQNGKINPLDGEKIDITTSKEPFVIVYNKNGEVIDSTGVYNGQVPKLPDGVLPGTVEGEKTIFTWEPIEDVRIAAVVVSSGKYGYVLAGKSLVDTENSLNKFSYILLVTFGLLLVGISVVAFVHHKKQ